MAKEKKYIDLEIIGTYNTIKYEGRCLGLLTSEEYAAVFKDFSLRNKLLTVPTTSISEIKSLHSISGLRLAIAVRKRKSIEVQKTLVITEPLTEVLYEKDGEMVLTGIGGTTINISEKSTVEEKDASR